MQPFWSTHFMLPSQQHPHAQAIAESLDQARQQVAAMIGCDPFEVVFTSSGTEANNLAIRCLVGDRQRGHDLLTEIEHDSVRHVVEQLPRGWEVEFLPVTRDGSVDVDRVADAVRRDTMLVCLQLVNPILGVVQPVAQVADVCSKRGVFVHCDASGAFGKMAVDVNLLGVDTLSVSSHKIYGPKGCGALYVRKGLSLAPLVFGEPREMGLLGGVENVPACIGFGVAAGLASRCFPDVTDNLELLRDSLYEGVVSSVEGVLRYGGGLSNTLALGLPVEASRVLKRARELVVSAPLSVSPDDGVARCFRSIGLGDQEILRSVSVSVGWTTTRDQVDLAIGLLADACTR